MYKNDKELSSEIDMILYILRNMPKEYANTIDIYEEDLSESKFTLQILRNMIRSKYRRNQKESWNLHIQRNVAFLWNN
jgi:hypothetical protein